MASMSYRMGAGILTISISAFCREDMRDEGAMVAEEKAKGLPTLMVIPLGLFIVPVLISVILSPGIIKMVDAVRSFSGG
jgi:pilus assembly protein TadC